MRHTRFLPLILLVAAAPSKSQATSSSLQNLPNHGLVFTITRDDLSDPAGPAELRKCLAHNPALACVGFTVTLRNDGPETILFWSTSCPREDPEVDYKKPDGEWEPFPKKVVGMIICNSTISGLGLIQPGKSYVTRRRLTDLSLDTEFHGTTNNDSGPRTHSMGYALLTTTSPFVIRLRRMIGGCITKHPMEGNDLPPPYSDATELCVANTSPNDQLVTLESNELQLSPTAEVDKLVQELVSRDQPRAFHQSVTAGLPDQGLLLTLAPDAPAPPGAAPLRPCFVDKPLLACAPFLIILKNRSEETITASFDNCGWRPYSADYKKPNGAWQPLPTNLGPVACMESNASGWVAIAAGKSYVIQARLAELGIDTGNALLAGSGPVTIRVHRALSGCVTRWPLEENETFNEPVASQQCLGRAFPEKPLAILESNELQLTATPAP